MTYNIVVHVTDKLEEKLQQQVMNNQHNHAKKHLKYSKSKTILSSITCTISICKFNTRYTKPKTGGY